MSGLIPQPLWLKQRDPWPLHCSSPPPPPRPPFPAFTLGGRGRDGPLLMARPMHCVFSLPPLPGSQEPLDHTSKPVGDLWAPKSPPGDLQGNS